MAFLTSALMTAAKFSILLLYMRLFRSDHGFRISVYITGGLCLAWFVAACLANALQCDPVRAGWDLMYRAILTKKAKVHCINFGAYVVGIEVPNALLDFVIAGIAVRVIRGLKLSVVQRVGIAVIFLCATL
jgi:hypothetical protein